MARKPNLLARTHILTVAQQLFYEQGYRGVSMDDIATAAGLKKANLFHYYPSREALGCAVIDHATAQMGPLIHDALAQGSTPIVAIERMFRLGEAWMGKSRCQGGCLIGNFAQELSDQHEALRVKIAAFLTLWTSEIGTVLSQGRHSGFFLKSLKPANAAPAILALFEGALTTSKALKSTHPLVQARQLTTTYLRSFMAASA